MSKFNETRSIYMLSWYRAIGSYIFATICGSGIGVAVSVPVYGVVWKVCFAVAVYLAAAVLYLWVVMVPPEAEPPKKHTRAMELFSRACAQGNTDVAANILGTGDIPNSFLQTEALSLYGDIESSPKNFQMCAWLVTQLCKKAPSVLWQTRDPAWANMVDLWVEMAKKS